MAIFKADSASESSNEEDKVNLINELNKSV